MFSYIAIYLRNKINQKHLKFSTSHAEERKEWFLEAMQLKKRVDSGNHSTASFAYHAFCKAFRKSP